MRIMPMDAHAFTELAFGAVESPFRIRDEQPRDAAAREALLDRSFGLERFAKTCERLREGRLPAQGLSFIATAGATIVGTLRFWHVAAGDRAALLLGPLAVDAAHRSAGIGRALIVHGLARAKVRGHAGVILVGDAPYYARFGFARAPAEALTLPGPVDLDRFLGLELVPGALADARGRVVGTGLVVDRRGSDDLRRAA
jgi:predicted N-acetyltransferase YhbS